MKIEIIDEIAASLQKRIDEKKDFETVEAYVNHVLKQVVERLAKERRQAFSTEEEEKVKERLKGWGYLS